MPRHLPLLMLPLSILAAAGFFLPWMNSLAASDQEALSLLPYLLAGAGLLMGLHFRRGRMVMALLFAVFLYHIQGSLLAEGLTSPESSLWYRALSLVLPANLLLLSAMREKGVWSNAGRLRVAVLAGQMFVVWFSIRYRYDGLWDRLSAPFADFPHSSWLLMPQGGVVLLAAAAVLSGAKGALRNSPIDGGLLGSSIGIFIVLNWMWAPNVPVVFCSATALALIASLLHDSYNMAFCDELTGLPSRRAMKEELFGIGRKYAAAVVDVDHFKRFNDNYGHSVGDQVLKMVATKLARVSGGGRAYRYGGEEFVILFPGKGEREAFPHLEELRKNIAEYRMVLRDEQRPKDDDVGKNRRSGQGGDKAVGVTVSIGVAASSPDGGIGADEVIKAADRALYRAKNKGRNQVCY